MDLTYSNQGVIKLMVVSTILVGKVTQGRSYLKFLPNTFQSFTSISFFLLNIPYVLLHNLKSLQIFDYEIETFILNVPFNHGSLKPCHISHLNF